MTATEPLRIGSLFSGVGGLDLAVQAALGGETVFVADVCKVDKNGKVGHYEPHRSPCSVLAHRFPGVPNLGDVSLIDWQEFRRMQPYKRRDDRAAAMYARYQEGLSLAKVAEEFGCTRQNVYDVFRWRDWPMRPKASVRPTVEWNGSKWSLRDNGYYGRTTGERDMMHRAVWEYHNGPIPDGWDVHHKDRDRTNNDVANLECLPKDAHTRLHAAEAAEEVMPKEASVIDVLAAGFP